MLSIEQFMREYKYFEHLGPVPFCTFVQNGAGSFWYETAENY